MLAFFENTVLETSMFDSIRKTLSSRNGFSRNVIPALVVIGAFVGAISVTQGATQNGTSLVHPRPDALLQVDMNREAIVARILDTWKVDFPVSQRTSLRTKLVALRADELLAANLSGSFDRVLEILARHENKRAEVITGPGSNQHKELVLGEQAKALGEANRDLVYTPVIPCRFFDTRQTATPTKISAGTSRDFDVIALTFTPQGGVPSNCEIDPNAVAIAINYVATAQDAAGYAVLYPAGTSLPPASSVNFPIVTVQSAEANFGIFPICKTNCPDQKEISVFVSETTHFLADIVGYFMPPVRGGDGLRITSVGAISPNMVGGAAANVLRTGVRGATIAGGGVASLADPDYGGDAPNQVTDHYGFVGGGMANRAGNDNSDVSDAAFSTAVGGRGNIAAGGFSFIGGGLDNIATGFIGTIVGGEFNQAPDGWAFVGGGQFNNASGVRSAIAGGQSNTSGGSGAFVGGGGNNSAAGPRSIVSGGISNTASGQESMVLGGVNNVASGSTSLAAGRKANASLAGCFVWGDSLDAVVDCAAADEFVARARGGFKMITGGTQGSYVGAVLPSGSTAWTALSDVGSKTAMKSITPIGVLNALVKMPILSWQYKHQPPNVRHIGPTAQDFHKAFGFGETPLGISTIDADGVTFAAIQGLNQKLTHQSKMKEKMLAKQSEKIRLLERELEAIKRRLGL
jgi:hypothetical protein